MSQAPQTYQQWLECLLQLEKQPWNRDLLTLVRQGRYEGKPSESFLSRVSDSVSIMLSGCTRRFLRELDRALSDGEPDMAVLLAKRFRRNVAQCMFYRDLDFLSGEYIQTLDEGFENQLQAFWKDFLSQLNKSARDSMDPRMEDMALELRRISITEPGRSEAKV